MASSGWESSNARHILPSYLYEIGLYGGTDRNYGIKPKTNSFLSPNSRVSNLFGRNFNVSASHQEFDKSLEAGRYETQQARAPRAAKFMIPSTFEPGAIELYSTKYFLTCAVGGMLCCGLTHCGMTPVDVVKCNMQIDPVKYKSIAGGFRTAIAEQGYAGLLRGWVPTLLGYSVQGAGKYGFYEYFKYSYSQKVGPEAAHKYKTLVYLAASGSGEFLADIGLSPFEAVKVRIQTQPGFAKGISDGLPKLIGEEGVYGLYRGIVPLWGRQIPYTMMKFATFESTIEALYKNLIPVPKEELSSVSQLGVSFVAGYIAGIACAIISHPADNLVSYLNNQHGATVSQAFKDMGTVALFTRGLPLRIFMIGTLTAAQWGIYDSFKVMVGLPTTGGPAVHEASSSETS